MDEQPTLTGLSNTDADVDAEPTVIDFTEGPADELFAAVSKPTACAVLQRRTESPGHPSALADAIDTSVQYVHHHLDRFESAGAVEIVDTIYSEKGQGIAVYAPTANPLLVVSRDRDDRDELGDALSDLVSAVGVLALGSVAVGGGQTPRLSGAADSSDHQQRPVWGPANGERGATGWTGHLSRGASFPWRVVRMAPSLTGAGSLRDGYRAAFRLGLEPEVGLERGLATLV